MTRSIQYSAKIPEFPIDMITHHFPKLGKGLSSLSKINQVDVSQVFSSFFYHANHPTQLLYDCYLFSTHRVSTSSFSILIADSSERKDSTHGLFSRALTQYQKDAARKYYDIELPDYLDAKDEYERQKTAYYNYLKKKKNENLNDNFPQKRPIRPKKIKQPQFVTHDPSPEALNKAILRGHPHFSINATEGGVLIGGIAMAKDNALRFAAQLCNMKSRRLPASARVGDLSYKQIEDGEIVTLRENIGCNMFLSVQPDVFNLMLSKDFSHSQGFLQRIFFSFSKSLKGERKHAEITHEDEQDLKYFKSYFNDSFSWLYKNITYTENEEELILSHLRVHKQDMYLVTEFLQNCEEMASNRQSFYDHDSSFWMSRAGEHLAVLASTLQVFKDSTNKIHSSFIERDILLIAMKLVEYYFFQFFYAIESTGKSGNIKKFTDKNKRFIQVLKKVLKNEYPNGEPENFKIKVKPFVYASYSFRDKKTISSYLRSLISQKILKHNEEDNTYSWDQYKNIGEEEIANKTFCFKEWSSFYTQEEETPIIVESTTSEKGDEVILEKKHIHSIDINEVKEKNSLLDEVIQSGLQFKKSGAKTFVALCPFHKEKTPSFTVFQDTNTWKCFGCGEVGDIFTWKQKTKNMSFAEILKELTGQLPSTNLTIQKENNSFENVQKIWDSCSKNAAFLIPYFINNRLNGIRVCIPWSIRYGKDIYFNKEKKLSAAICAIRKNKELIGIHRLFLSEDPFELIKDQKGKRIKKVLGKIKGGSIELKESSTAKVMVICEGIETGLSILALISLGKLEFIPEDFCLHSAINADNMKELTIPNHIEKVIIAADNDQSGREAANKAKEKYSENKTVDIIYPSQGKDFNDELNNA